MLIKKIPSGPFETNAYVIVCEDTKNAAIIDPAPESASALCQYLEANQFIPKKILLTHSHWDHIADVHELKEKFNIPVYIHAADAANLESPGSDGLPLWITIPGVKADGYLKEGDIVEVGNLKFKVIETPGHSPGGICLFGEGVLISGDTLFKGSIGRLEFSTGEPEKMWKSLDKLAKLPPETRVYPGHGPATTIGNESWLPDAKRMFE